MATYYWCKNSSNVYSGTWNNTAGHWSTSSASTRTAGSFVPTASDNVIFDQYSASATVNTVITIDVGAVCLNMTVVGVPTGTPNLKFSCPQGTTINMYGNLSTDATAVSVTDNYLNINFVGAGTGSPTTQTASCAYLSGAGKTFLGNIVVNGTAQRYSLALTQIYTLDFVVDGILTLVNSTTITNPFGDSYINNVGGEINFQALYYYISGGSGNNYIFANAILGSASAGGFVLPTGGQLLIGTDGADIGKTSEIVFDDFYGAPYFINSGTITLGYLYNYGDTTNLYLFGNTSGSAAGIYGTVQLRGTTINIGNYSGPLTALSFTNLLVTGASGKSTLNIAGALTFTGGAGGSGSFNFSGNSAVNRLSIKAPVFGTPLTISVPSTGTASILSNCDLQDIAITAGKTVSTTTVGDLGGNSGFIARGVTTFTGTINNGSTLAGTVLTVAASPAPTGTIGIGTPITGGTTSAGTYITALGTGTGGAGTYTVNNSQLVASAAMSSKGLNFYAVTSGNNINWSNTSMWAYNSGGLTTTTRIPLAQDTVTFDAASGSGYVTVDVENLPKVTIDSAYTNKFSFYSPGGAFVDGSLINTTSVNGSFSIGGVFQGYISNGSGAAGTTLVITSVTSGKIGVGLAIYGTGINSITTVTALGSGTGGAGTYVVDKPWLAGSVGTPITISANSEPGSTITLGQVVVVSGTNSGGSGLNPGSYQVYATNNNNTFGLRSLDGVILTGTVVGTGNNTGLTFTQQGSDLSQWSVYGTDRGSALVPDGTTVSEWYNQSNWYNPQAFAGAMVLSNRSNQTLPYSLSYGNLIVYGPTATYTLSNASLFNSLSFYFGTLAFGSNTVNFNNLSIGAVYNSNYQTATATATAGSGTATLTNFGFYKAAYSNTNLTVNQNGNGSFNSLNGGFYKLNLGNTTGSRTTVQIFNDVNTTFAQGWANSASNINVQLSASAGQVFNVNPFNLTGSPSDYINLSSTSSGSQAYLTTQSGLSTYYITYKDINSTNTIRAYGANVNLGNNTNILFIQGGASGGFIIG